MSEKKKETGADSASPLKKKSPLIIIAAVLVVCLMAAAVVGKQVSASSSHVKKVEKGPVMVLDEFLVNLADPGGDHLLKVSIGLELKPEKGKTADSLKEQIAPIRDAILVSLSTKTRDQLTPVSGREKLKAEIKKRVNAALGEEDVQEVYFTNLVMQ